VLSDSSPHRESSSKSKRSKRRKSVAGGLDILSSRVLAEVERHSTPEEGVLFCLTGSLNHSLIAFDERLLIVKPGFHAGTTFGSLTTTFYYQDVTGIQLHTFLFSGWIEVSSPSFQGRERKRNRQPRSSNQDVYKLPSCVPISKRRVDDYRPYLARLRERIEHCKRHGRAPADTPPLVGSLERIAELHRSGVLSEAEFERLKRVLLENADGGTAPAPPAAIDRKASGF
jgi:hypothetical protein